MFLLFGAFVAGMLTVLAPCVLPLLPIIIGGSVSGNVRDRKRPIIIAISLAVSLIFFTLLLKATTLFINVPPQIITYISGGIIVALGLFVLFPTAYAKLLIWTGLEQRSQKLLGKSFQNKQSYIGPIITGAALGPVFSSCSPVYAYILATVLPVNFGQALAYIIAYVAGLTIVLLAVGYYGQQFVGRIKFAADPKGLFQRVLAIIFIIVGVLVFSGYDKQFQTWVSQHTPFNFDALSSNFLPDSKNKVDSSKLFNVATPYPAPELVGTTDWINSDPLTIAKLKGKVVMLDFWTYSCINCIRNNPYIEKWYQAYKDDGFVVVAVHAPEFAFEKNPVNVRKAVKEQKLSYPVTLDNDFSTWNAYDNRSWPASYLIDASGQVRRIHEGEGAYAESEQAIRQLLQDNGAKLDSKMAVDIQAAVPISAGQTPETYIGYRRASNYAGQPALAKAPLQTFGYPAELKVNQWALSGSWEGAPDKATARGNSKLQFKFAAKELYVVLGSASKVTAKVTIDGQPATASNGAGPDVKDGVVTIDGNRLYRLVSFPSFKSGSQLELSLPDGVEVNAFTFGS